MYSTQDRLLLLAYVAYSDECSSHLMVSASRDRRPSSPFGGLVVSHVRKWFSVCRTPHAQFGESVIFHLCSVSIVRPIPVYAHGRVAPSTGEEVMFHCTCWPLVGTPGNLLLLFCHSLCHLSLSHFFPGCFSLASTRRASTSLWKGLRHLRRGGFLCFVTQSYRRWLGLLAAAGSPYTHSSVFRLSCRAKAVQLFVVGVKSLIHFTQLLIRYSLHLISL